MLVRCGGNVIEIGRRQLVVVTSAGLVSLLVTLYCVSLLYGPNHAEIVIARYSLKDVVDRCRLNPAVLGVIRAVEKTDAVERHQQ